MKIKWYGHSCFLIEHNNFKIVTDPFGDCVNYRLPDLTPDIITVSHYHEDHFSEKFAENIPVLDYTNHDFCYKDIIVKGIESFHDENNGKDRGSNIIFSFQIDNINIISLGDLGEKNFLLNNYFKKIDILMAPFGGIYTIDGIESYNLAKKNDVKILIPMHYKTAEIDFELNKLEDYNLNYKTEDFIELNNSQMLPKNLEIIKLKIFKGSER